MTTATDNKNLTEEAVFEIRFHVRCCVRRGRTLIETLDQVHRSHGYYDQVAEVARSEWRAAGM